MSNFEFLTTEWKDIHVAASKAESTATPDLSEWASDRKKRQNRRKINFFSFASELKLDIYV